MSAITCPNCGITDEARYSFCSHCGKLFPPESADETENDGASAERTGATLEEYSETFAWLQGEQVDDVQGDAPSEPPDEGDSQPDHTRTLDALPNLLEPLSLASLLSMSEATEADLHAATASKPTIRMGDDSLRQIRQLMTSEPPIAERTLRTGPSLGQNSPSSLKVPWVFWLLGLMVGLPIFLQLPFPSGGPQALPGLAEAFNSVDALADGAEVLIIWAYDPATSGEMDLVVQPLLYHLLKQRNPMAVVSLLPAGPASVQQILQKLSTETDIGLIDPIVTNYGFLPGSSTILPLVGQDLASALRHSSLEISRSIEALPARNLQQEGTPNPQLVLVVAAQAEEVQHWLEQAKPLNQIPVIAAVGAGADLVLRPYLDSQQLIGMVSGFDGGGAYQALLDRTEDAPLAASALPAAVRQRQQIVFQNWGHLAFLVLIFLGNFALLINQRSVQPGDGPSNGPVASPTPPRQRGGRRG